MQRTPLPVWPMEPGTERHQLAVQFMGCLGKCYKGLVLVLTPVCTADFANSTSESYAYVDSDPAVADYQEGSTVTGSKLMMKGPSGF